MFISSQIQHKHTHQLIDSKYLYYLSALQFFNQRVGKIASMQVSEMGTVFTGVPSQLIAGIVERFTENSGKKHTLTDSRKTKLMAHMCVLYLTIDGWSTDIAKVATDLKMKTPKSVHRRSSILFS
jgi:DNA-directed RNA polymerase I subunit RPA49